MEKLPGRQSTGNVMEVRMVRRKTGEGRRIK
jgi:hypothetical protein